jgi:hypothetical protein
MRDLPYDTTITAEIPDSPPDLPLALYVIPDWYSESCFHGTFLNHDEAYHSAIYALYGQVQTNNTAIGAFSDNAVLQARK